MDEIERPEVTDPLLREAYGLAQIPWVPPKKVTQEPRKVVRGRESKYPWEFWTDGDYHIITPGNDFEMPPARMQTMLYRKAEDLGIYVKTERVRIDDLVCLGFMYGTDKTKLGAAWVAMLEAQDHPGGRPDGRLNMNPREGWHEVGELEGP